MTTAFEPAWWLPNGHLQTLWPVWFRKRLTLELSPETVPLSDGDVIHLSWLTKTDAPIILLIHGLEGSVESQYIKPLMQKLYEVGFSSVCMHLRGSSTIPNRKPYSYHSGRTQDVNEVLTYLNTTQRTVAGLIGFSLGGNLVLKYLGEQADHTYIKAAVAVSIPFELENCSKKLENGLSVLYGRYLLGSLKNSYKTKFKTQTSPLAVDIDQVKTMYEFDDKITAPLNGFQNAHDYYTKSSSKQFLSNIKRPTLILHALDDPFMYPSIAPRVQEVSPCVTLDITPSGGHVGFVSGRYPWRAEYWLDTRISEWLREQLLVNPER